MRYQKIVVNCKKRWNYYIFNMQYFRKRKSLIIKKFLEKNTNYTTTEIKIDPTEKQDGFYIAKLIKK